MDRADDAFRDFVARPGPDVKIVELSMKSGLSPLNDVVSILRLARVLRAHRPDVIHVHSGKAGLLGRMAALAAAFRTPVLYTPNASPFRTSRVHHFVEKTLCRFTAQVIAVSDSEYDELLLNQVVSAEQLVTIWNGIDVEECQRIERSRDDVRAELGVPRDAILVGAAGRLAPQKSPETFVRMAAKVHAARPDIYFAWVGDGEMRAAFEAAVEHSGLRQRLTLAGYTRDLRPYLNAFDICCMLSDYEGMPYVALEAMAAGLPLVGTRVPGLVDAIADETTGFLVPVRDPLCAAERVLLLCDSGDLRRSQSAAARQRVTERFSVHRMAADTYAAYVRLWSRANVRTHLGEELEPLQG